MKSCLVVEDSAVVRQLAVRIITELGLSAREAENAADAVEMCRMDAPDAVLLDWDLPSMGALDFLRGVGALPPDNRPVIILCATENDPQQFLLAKAAGAAFHMLKPYDKGAITERLTEAGIIDRVDALLGRAASNG